MFTGGDLIGSKDKYNARHYDSTLIRFPAGTLARFRQLFGNVSFNGWVSDLVVSRLVMAELRQGDDKDDSVT